MPAPKKHGLTATTLREIPDEGTFKISAYNHGVTYRLERKEENQGIITSVSSGHTYRKPLTQKVFLCEE
jgi:hypothetical protein